MDLAANAGGLTVLLSAIDANGDGRLSASELSHLDDLFRLLDLNDDEQISRSEFVAPVDARWVVERSDRGKGGSALPFEQILRTADKTDLVGRLIRTFGILANDAQVRGKDAAGKQPSTRLGLPLAIFGTADNAARFDKNGDKRLDERELAEWLSDPQPHCELTVEIAAASLQEPQVKVVRVLPAAGEAALSVESPTSGGALLHLSSIPLEIRAAEPARRAAARTSRYRAMFKRADQNNNNYIESSEIANAGQGLGSVDFSAMDRDHNGMVFEDEWIAYLRLRDALAEARLSLTIAVESIDPLAQFDANHDGRLNRTEFGRALAAVASWDRNHDGFVTPDEIPRTLVGTFHIGPLRAAPVRRPRSARMERSQPPSAGPIWFQKMDRNHDGEVSLREFLGPLSVFRRLDANGDGRLDPHEAESAQK
jgi:Ca2+-binding EF-hand superfamily protein